MRLSLKIDFDRDGDFDEDFEDVSDKIRNLQFKRGRESSYRLFSVTSSLNFNAVLLDLGGEFSLRKPNSELNLKSVINADFVLVAEFENENVTLATGYVSEFQPTRGLTHPSTVTMSGIGILGRLRDFPVNVATASDITITEAIRRVLRALAVHSSQYSLDNEDQTISYWGVRDVTAREELVRLEASSDGIIREDRYNRIVFEERTNRASSSTGLTFSDDPNVANSYKFANIEVIRRLENVRNEFQVGLRSYTIDSDYSDIWSISPSGSLALVANSSFDFVVEFPNDTSGSEYVGVDEWEFPLVGTNIIITKEDGTLLTSEESNSIVITERVATFGRYEFSIQNTSSETLFVDTMNIRGKRVSSDVGGYVVRSDRDSKTRYGTRVFKNESAIYVEDIEFASNWASFSLSLYKEPFDNYKIKYYLAKDGTDDVLKELLKQDVSDKVRVVTGSSSKLFVNEYCYIESVHIEYKKGGQVGITYELSAGEVSGAFWILGTSELGIDTRLGY